jgi:DNA (cytosine-5)-methyltransferase 1
VDVAELVKALNWQGLRLLSALILMKMQLVAIKRTSNTKFIRDDIRNIKVKDVAKLVPDLKSSELVFCACAPCQPFSSQNKIRNSSDKRRTLLGETKRFIRAFRPAFIFIENVPGIQSIKIEENGPFSDFLNFISRFGYQYDYKVVSSEFYGVPQQRKRLVVLARLNDKPIFPSYSHGVDNIPFATVRDYIGSLPKLQAGESDSNDLLHAAAVIQPINIKRYSIHQKVVTEEIGLMNYG